MDVETAIAKVKSLGDAAIKWRDIIREYREGTPVSEPELRDDAPGGKVFAGLMQV